MKSTYKRYSGFTLLEALVSCMLLAIAAVTFNGISTQCLTQIQKNQKREIAWQMLHRQMSMIKAMGIEEFINEGTMQGEIEPPPALTADTTYQWVVTTEKIDIDYLYQVSLAIVWEEKGQPRRISTGTFMNGTGSLIE